MGDDEDSKSSHGTEIVSALPNLHDWLSSWLGINLPNLPPLPQTIKNFDKALGRLVLATGDNLSSRLENNTLIRSEKRKAVEAVIKASTKEFVGEIKNGGDQYSRAIEYTFGESFLYQKNRENVAKLAIEHIASVGNDDGEDAKNDISDDWLNAFSDLVGKKSNEDVQALWAKILAGEIRKPGSFKLKSLLSMAAIDSSDAAQIDTLLSKAVNANFIFKVDDNEDLGPYMNAESLDVLMVGGGLLTKRYNVVEHSFALFVVASTVIRAESSSAQQILLPQFALTQFGKDLHFLSNHRSVDEEYIQALIAKLRSYGLILKRAYLLKPLKPNGDVFSSVFIDC